MYLRFRKGSISLTWLTGSIENDSVQHVILNIMRILLVYFVTILSLRATGRRITILQLKVLVLCYC